MGNRSSLILLPITIALIAFVAFSVWIWLSFEKEKSIYGERMAILATGIAYPFDMAIRDMRGWLDTVPNDDPRRAEFSTPNTPALAHLKIRLARHAVGDQDGETVPPRLAEALREAAKTRALYLSSPYHVEGDDERVALVEARFGADQHLSGFAVVSFSLKGLNDWWAQMRRPLDVGVMVLRPGGAVWLGAFLGERFAEDTEATHALARLGRPDTPIQGWSEVPNLLGGGHSALIGWARIEALPLSVATVASKAHIRTQWADHYAMLLMPSVVATAVVVVVVFWTVLSVLREAERREAATAALRQSEYQTTLARQQLIDAIESMSEGFVLFDKEDRLILSNHKLRDIFAAITDHLAPGTLYRDQLTALADAKLVADLPADPSARDAWIEERLTEHRRGDEKHELRLGDGRTILCKEFPIRGGGTVGIRTDITAQKAAETAIREQAHFMEVLLDTVPAPIFYKDTAGRYLGCNKAFEDYVGTSEDKLIGLTVYDVAPPELAQRYFDADRAMIEGPNKVQVYETPVRYADGQMRAIMFHKAVFHDADGKPAGLVGVMLDISERKRVEDALVSAAEAAQAANRSKTEFLANMSHELRTPLNAIIGFSHLMTEETFGPMGTPQYRDYARDILNSGHHLLSLINDILDVSAIEAGHLELSESTVDISGLMHNCQRMIRHRAQEAGLTLRVDTPLSPPNLWGDERRVRQVLLNLLANAVKFTPRGGEVALTVTAENDGALTFTISDTGIGIAAEDIPKILRPFEKVSSSLTHAHEGIGLGLPLSLRLVELHGGTLRIDSEVNVGTRVAIRFPAARSRPPTEMIR